MTAMSHQVGRLLELVSPRVGVVRSLSRVPRGVDEPSPPILYHAQLSHFDFRRGKLLERSAFGKGFSEDEAMGSALGEAIERYCAHHADTRAIRGAKAAALDTPFLSPAECVLYSEPQYARKSFPYARWDEQTETSWLPGVEFPGNTDVLLPAALVYMNYSGPNNDEYFCPSTSNGMAAGPDLDSAVLAGLCELVERDGFLIHWMNRLTAPEVEFAGGTAGAIREYYARFGVEVRVFDLSTDVPAAVMMAVALTRRDRGPAAVVGLGCHPSPEKALVKALGEVCQVRPGEVKRFLETDPAKLPQLPEAVKTLEDHSGYFFSPERLPELAFLLDNGRRRRLEEMPDRSQGSLCADLHNLVAGLRGAGCRVAFVDVTSPDIQPYPVRAVRTFATGLQPIHFGYGEEHLGGRRLFEAPRRLGYGGGRRSESELNPCPHPLP